MSAGDAHAAASRDFQPSGDRADQERVERLVAGHDEPNHVVGRITGAHATKAKRERASLDPAGRPSPRRPPSRAHAQPTGGTPQPHAPGGAASLRAAGAGPAAEQNVRAEGVAERPDPPGTKPL